MLCSVLTMSCYTAGFCLSMLGGAALPWRLAVAVFTVTPALSAALLLLIAKESVSELSRSSADIEVVWPAAVVGGAGPGGGCRELPALLPRRGHRHRGEGAAALHGVQGGGGAGAGLEAIAGTRSQPAVPETLPAAEPDTKHWAGVGGVPGARLLHALSACQAAGALGPVLGSRLPGRLPLLPHHRSLLHPLQTAAPPRLPRVRPAGPYKEQGFVS